MATGQVRWRPDSCACEIVYTWNDAVQPMTFVGTETVVACPAHAAAAALGPAQHYDAVRGENYRKNRFLGIAIAAVAPLADGQNLRAGIEYVWTLDASRVLQARFTGITLNAQQRSQLQALADAEFGPGKVVVS